MKLRLTGTRAECDRFTTDLIAATPPGVVREVSDFYPNRGSNLQGRVYLDLHLPAATVEADTPAPTPARRSVRGGRAERGGTTGEAVSGR